MPTYYKLNLNFIYKRATIFPVHFEQDCILSLYLQTEATLH